MTADLYNQLVEALHKRQLVGVATVIAGPGLGNKVLIWPNGKLVGTLGSADLDQQVIEQAAEPFQRQQAARFVLPTAAGECDIFLEIHAPPPKLIIVGAVHIAIPLVTFAKTLGFETLVLDARAAFATEERFSHADELIIRWPADTLAELPLDEATYLVFLTHDEKIDNPALQVALASNVRYIGALGSRKTHAKRVAALQELGVDEAALARIHAPIGLNIGARRPEEIAVSIIGQIVEVRNR
jgi:xanthine dehydrogenase accessory factor